MQQWEYCTALLSAVVHFGNYQGWRLKEINERRQPDGQEAKEYTSVADFCNQMGQQGWELISANGSLRSTSIELYFKRPRMDKTS